jgi:hypothetical protein
MQGRAFVFVSVSVPTRRTREGRRGPWSMLFFLVKRVVFLGPTGGFRGQKKGASMGAREREGVREKEKGVKDGERQTDD